MKKIMLISFLSIATAHSDYYDLVPLEITTLAKKPSDLLNFVDCLLDRGRCNDVYEVYRAYASEAVRTACQRCTVDQKRFGYGFLLTLKKLFPYEYHNFRHKYDPDSKYFDALENELYKYKLLPCL